MKKVNFDYFDVWFFVRFAVVFLVLYGICLAMIGVTTPGGTFYPFVDRYLNFPVVIRNTILFGGKVLCSLGGISTNIVGSELITADGSNILRMGWVCYGLMINSFWIAFVVAHQDTFRRKLFWTLGGCFAIYLINCTRVFVLMYSMVHDWSIGDKLSSSNHDLFNYAAYVAIIGLMLIFKRGSSGSATAAIG